MRNLSLIRTPVLTLVFVLSLMTQGPQPLLEARQPAATASPAGSVVLAADDDPYYPLAEEIARREGLPIAHGLDEALLRGPAFLLWVASPSRLSDRVLIGTSLRLTGRPSPPAVGIISGATIESARQLWLRAGQVSGEQVVVANGAYPSAGIVTGRLIAIDQETRTTQPLHKGSLRDALQKAGYLTFTGHGGRGYWRLDDETQFIAADVPPLPPIVIATASCSTFRLWEKGSIALAFASQGAAAYAGFSYSPNEGYLIGEFDGLPFRYTWPEFPIGYVIQVQNRGTLQGFAALPYYWLLGDPRIALQARPLFQPERDELQGNLRTLVYADLPAGTIPLRIPGGAGYSFVEAVAVTAASTRDPFYNSRLQMADIGADKYLLVDQRGGGLTVRLRRGPPLLWLPLDVLTDCLDHTLLYIQQNGGDLIGMVLGVLALLPVAWRLRRRAPARLLMPAAAAGVLMAGLHGLYALARLGQVTITSKPVALPPLALLGTFLLAGCGAFLFLSAGSRLGREVAVWLAVCPVLAAGLFSAAVVAALNLLVFAPQIGSGLYNHALGLLALGTLIVECTAFDLAFSLLHRWAAGASPTHHATGNKQHEAPHTVHTPMGG